MQSIGQKIYTLRKERGMTQQQVADILNVSHHTVSKWELGINSPSIDDMQRIANLFDVNVRKIIGNIPDKLDIREFLDEGLALPEDEMDAYIDESTERIFSEGLVGNKRNGIRMYVQAWLAYFLWKERKEKQDWEWYNKENPGREETLPQKVESWCYMSQITDSDESQLIYAYAHVPLDSWVTKYLYAYKLSKKCDRNRGLFEEKVECETCLYEEQCNRTFCMKAKT